MRNRLIIAVDFDGTVVKHAYPGIGEDIGAIPWLKLAQERADIILWTMRSGNTLEEAKLWLVERGIELFGVNRNPEQRTWTASPKAFANIYIDDAALGVPLVEPTDPDERPWLDWSIIGPMLIDAL